MYQLNYKSQATNDLTLKDLYAILSAAIHTNSVLNISGCLIFHNGFFVQILEGNKEDVLNIFEKIKDDNRHQNIELLATNYVENRTFPEWSMAYHEPSDATVSKFVDNLIIMAELSDKTTESLKAFWSEIKKILIKN